MVPFSFYELLEVALAVFLLAIILFAAEALKRIKVLKREFARKSIHISSGLLSAALPVALDFDQIMLFHAAFFAGVLLFSGYIHVFSVVHAVKRWTIGEYLFPLSAGLIAWMFPDVAIYSFSVLVMTLGDGFAGLVGKTYGKKSYKVEGGEKTYLGSAVFFGITMMLMLIFVTGFVTVPFKVLLLLPVLAAGLTVAEAIITGGFDNLTVPLVSAGVFAWLTTVSI